MIIKKKSSKPGCLFTFAGQYVVVPALNICHPFDMNDFSNSLPLSVISLESQYVFFGIVITSYDVYVLPNDCRN